jgi:FtsZ-binding cell division protein ZapB
MGLRRSRDQLEVRIRERTQELAGTHVALQSEVAERKQKERDLHHAREKLRRRAEEISRLASIVEASHDAIMEVSLDGVVRSWNVGAQVNAAPHTRDFHSDSGLRSDRCFRMTLLFSLLPCSTVRPDSILLRVQGFTSKALPSRIM